MGCDAPRTRRQALVHAVHGGGGHCWALHVHTLQMQARGCTHTHAHAPTCKAVASGELLLLDVARHDQHILAIGHVDSVFALLVVGVPCFGGILDSDKHIAGGVRATLGPIAARALVYTGSLSALPPPPTHGGRIVQECQCFRHCC